MLATSVALRPRATFWGEKLELSTRNETSFRFVEGIDRDVQALLKPDFPP